MFWTVFVSPVSVVYRCTMRCAMRSLCLLVYVRLSPNSLAWHIPRITQSMHDSCYEMKKRVSAAGSESIRCTVGMTIETQRTRETQTTRDSDDGRDRTEKHRRRETGQRARHRQRERDTTRDAERQRHGDDRDTVTIET
ncbi:hypothetical protein CALVIDRAFT_348720 [Calocera viscosa TUFC12733]|uniref:Uncharacterized protein n=1 Tax=Calocera viscosa (strain TUFC12733) TaxID=1330018 RepID=A0A167H9F5_CALVF|nr:hypothetical protein CALVIDRAFT_348720 [Calocera viscosa TUFC12733]